MIEKLEKKVRISKLKGLIIGLVFGIVYIGFGLILRYNNFGHIAMDVQPIIVIICFMIFFMAIGYVVGILLSQKFKIEIEEEKLRQRVMKLFMNGEIQVDLKDNSGVYSNLLVAICNNYELKYFADKEDEYTVKVIVRDLQENVICIQKYSWRKFYNKFYKILNNTVYTYEDINN